MLKPFIGFPDPRTLLPTAGTKLTTNYADHDRGPTIRSDGEYTITHAEREHVQGTDTTAIMGQPHACV